MDIRFKRAHETPAANDGLRVLIDRIWPRGVSREALEFDAWRKELAPSHTLRNYLRERP